METEAHRAHVTATAARLPGARIWPNGLGLDWRGWELLYHPATPNLIEHWTACHKGENRVRYAEGPTPEAAYMAARLTRGEER